MLSIFKHTRILIISILMLAICTVTVGAYEALVKKITVIDNGISQSYSTGKEIVRDFLDDQGIKVNEYDEINVSLDARLEDNQTIKINRAVSITIDIDGIKSNVTTCKSTVGELLDEKHVVLGDKDKINWGEANPLSDGMNIQIETYQELTVTENEKIPFKTEERENSNLPIGEKQTVQTGSDGEKINTYNVIYIGGKETDRKFVSETVVKEAVNTVIEIGTKKPVEVKKEEPVKQTAKVETNNNLNSSSSQAASTSYRTVNTGNGTKEYTRVLDVVATAYTPNDGGGNGITYSGMKARPGVIAVDPNVIPLHSRVYVEGYGEAIAGDTGGAIKGNRIDVCFDSYDTVRNYGVRNVKIYILK